MPDELRVKTQEEEELSGFLAALGSAVRQKRKALGFSRRKLSELSGVSERYLAQLETGAGNISVVFLYKIAKALDIPPQELLTIEAVEQKKGICFIGLRGAGKSTLGQKLATSNGLRFVELNQVIENQSGMPIGEVMALYGQEGYRDLERKALESLKDLSLIVLAVGGGLVSSSETYEFLRANYVTVWLKAKPEDHMERVMAQGDVRPMSGNPQAMADLKRILTSREELYRQADATIVTSGKTIDEVLRELRILVRDFNI